MHALSQEEAESLFGVSCFSHLCGSSPEGSQLDATEKGAPAVRCFPLASSPQSLTLDGGIQIDDISAEDEAPAGCPQVPSTVETSASTPPKRPKATGCRDETDRRAPKESVSHVGTKGLENLSSSSNSSCCSSLTAGGAFHSTGLAALTAVVAAASAAAAGATATGTKNTRSHVGGPQGPYSRRLWLRPSEFSLLAQIKAQADAATATQIQAAAEAAAAALRTKALMRFRAHTADSLSAADPTCRLSSPLPASSPGGPPGAPQPGQPAGGSSNGSVFSSVFLDVTVSRPSLEEIEGTGGGHQTGPSEDSADLGLGKATELVEGTWIETDSQGGPEGATWRTYTPDGADCCSSLGSSSCHNAGKYPHQQETPAAAEEADLLPPTQKTQEEPPIFLSVGPAAALDEAAATAPSAAQDAPLPSTSNLAGLAAAAAQRVAAAAPQIPAAAPQAAVGPAEDGVSRVGKEGFLGLPACSLQFTDAAAPTKAAAAATAAPPAEAVNATQQHTRRALDFFEGLLSKPATPRRLREEAAAATAAGTTAAATARGKVLTARVAAGGSGGILGPADGIASPYVTPPRGIRSQGAPGPGDDQHSGPPTPTSTSLSASRRGRLKSTARLAASSLSRAAVEDMARRFPRLPLVGAVLGSLRVTPLSPLKKKRAGVLRQLPSEGGDATSNDNKDNRDGNCELLAPLTTEAGAPEGPQRLKAVKQERPTDPVQRQQPEQQEQEQPQQQKQQQQLLQVQAVKVSSSAIAMPQEMERREAPGDREGPPECMQEEGATMERPPSPESSGAVTNRVMPCPHLGKLRQLVGAPVAARQLEEVLRRGLYGFQVEGLLWMLQREGRLPTERPLAVPSQGNLSSLAQGSALFAVDRLGGGGILADDPGLGKTLQVVSLIAATVPISLLRGLTEGPQSQIKENDAGAREMRSLVLTPASLVPQWEAEIYRICGMKLGVLNIPRRLRETGSLLTPSVLHGIHVVLVSYEALLSVDCLCRPARPRAEKRRRQQQRVTVHPSLLHGDVIAGQDDDSFFAFTESSSSGASDTNTGNKGAFQEPSWFNPKTPVYSRRTSGNPCNFDGVSPCLSSPAFLTKLHVHSHTPDACTPKFRSLGSRVDRQSKQTEPFSPPAASAPLTSRSRPVAIWEPRGPRCACVRCFLLGFEWERLVLDEAHLVLRRRRLANTIKVFSAPYRWGLTATPGPPIGDLAGDPAVDPLSLVRLLGLLQESDEKEKGKKGGDARMVQIERCCCSSMPADVACCEGAVSTKGLGIFVLRRTHRDLKRRENVGKMCGIASAQLQKLQIQTPIRHPVLPVVQLKLQMLSFASPHELNLYKKIEGMAGRQLTAAARETAAPPVNCLGWILRLRQACLHFSLVPGDSEKEQNEYHSASTCITGSLSECGDSPMSLPVRRRQVLSMKSQGYRLGIEAQVGTQTIRQEQASISSLHETAEEVKPSHSTKTKAIISAVADILECNRDAKIVIVSAFTSFLKLLELHLAVAFRGRCRADIDVGSKVVKITGETKVVHRSRIIRQFATERNVNIMLLSALSASHGVDGLQTAGHLLICEPMMSPGRLRQVLGRLTRIGQAENQVLVKLFFVRNTIEHRILQLWPPIGLADSQFLSSDDGTTLPLELLLRHSSEQSRSHLLPPDDTFFLLGL